MRLERCGQLAHVVVIDAAPAMIAEERHPFRVVGGKAEIDVAGEDQFARR
jgi:hypothetical protein